MFCDEVYAQLESLDERRLLAETHKFVLTDDFQEVAGQISRTSEDCMALKHLFRLPHDKTWLEFTHESGFRFGVIIQNVTGTLREICQKAVKTGTYDGTYDDALYFTRTIAHTAMTMSWLAFPQTFELTADGKFNMRMAAFENLSEEHRTLAFDESILYCIYLATLNSRNLIEAESSDLERLNRRREKSNKPPLFEYKTLRIKRDIRRMMREAKAADIEEGIGVRAHWRRGHFKVRKTGVFWWSPHMAGKPELGRIEKKYVA